MHRDHVRELLQRYALAWPGEADLAARFAHFVDEHDDCLLRTCAPGHVTASAWILSPSGGEVLLTLHKKLGRWLQLGGHVDGERRIELAALREAAEESGLAGFTFEPWSGPDLVPLDLDVHPIPARGREPEHLHWDVRFLLRAPAGQPLVRSDESTDLRWFAADRLATVTEEESVLRLARKTRQLGRH